MMPPKAKPPHDPPCEIHPLNTWAELVGWSRAEEHTADQLLPRRLETRTALPQEPRTLLCHDMKGGYLDDRFLEGCGNSDAYRFYHWSGVDAFVYFSHHFVTLPPPGWVTAAHLHGVKVLGTLITEWDEGKVLCEQLLASEETVGKAVSQLVDIARFHGIEGWLINIENEIAPEKIPLLLKFVGDLTSGMRKDRGASSMVIWYDSVTTEGKLEWQNEVTALNEPFLHCSDGIFLNYTWTEEGLARSRAAAGDRATDVYVGLDVFGRNFYAGGKFDTWKALEVARREGLSAAIFAQGWTYETQGDFVGAERRVWRSLGPFLTHHGPERLPIFTSFCQGCGERSYMEGKTDGSRPWHNLKRQQLQPLWSQECEGACLYPVMSDAYEGGGCLGLTTTAPVTVKLLVCKAPWWGQLRLRLVYKWRGAAVPLAVQVCSVHRTDDSQLEIENSCMRLRCEGEEEEALGEQGTREVSPTENSTTAGWNVRGFSIMDKGGELRRIEVRVGGAASLRLGHLKVGTICRKGVHHCANANS